jgi:hypothetical protein
VSARALVLAVVALLASGAASAAEPTSAPGPAAEAATLDAIRGQLVALDIEGALAAIDALLAGPSLADATRAVALDLRAQAHVASDDLDAAEKDYRAILELRPGYVPDPQLTSKRAMERFARVAAATVGRVHVDLDPPDAGLLLDGRPVEPVGQGSFKAPAGDRRLRVERRGFDAADVTVHVVAGEETLLKLTLVPNARHVLVRTDVPGVVVMVDGTAAGATGPTAGAGSENAGPAELLLEDVAIGEHAIVLQKSCYATETIQEMVRVDLADRSPERMAVVTMRPARARVATTGAAYAAELHIDGEAVASLPLETFTMCPGRREIEVVASGRVVWSGTLDAGEADLTLDLSPRPNCVLVGAEWPKAWGPAASAWSLRGRVDPPAGADLATAAGWAKVELPQGTDLALGVLPRAGVAGEDRVVLYSPSLGRLEERPVPPPTGRPAWTEPSAGASFADGPAGVVAVTVAPGGPAAAAGLVAGDRVTAAAGRKVSRASEVDAAVVAAAGTRLALEIAPPAGERRALEMATVQRPRLDPDAGEPEGAIVRAAWCAAVAAAGGSDAAAALAQFAVLLERAGRDASAVDAWRKLRAVAGDRLALAARADYALGVASMSAGRPAEAAERFGRARSEATTSGDVGLASAAADRLADCGVAAR